MVGFTKCIRNVLPVGKLEKEDNEQMNKWAPYRSGINTESQPAVNGHITPGVFAREGARYAAPLRAAADVLRTYPHHPRNTRENSANAQKTEYPQGRSG